MGMYGCFMVKRVVDDANCLFHKLLLLGDESHHTAQSSRAVGHVRENWDQFCEFLNGEILLYIL
jgi:hypothetical protein